MIAIPKNDTYPDLQPNQEYEIERVLKDNYIILKGSQRRYKSNCFVIRHNGKKISHSEAYRRYKLDVVRRKLGM